MTTIRKTHYWFQFSPSGSVETCDQWRTAMSCRLMDVLLIQRIFGCPASVCSWKRKCCAGRGSGPCFQTVTSSPRHPFSRGEARKREKAFRSDRWGSESQHPLSLTGTFTLSLLYIRKDPSEICTQIHTQKETQIQASSPIWIPSTLTYKLTLVRTFTDFTFSLLLSFSNSLTNERINKFSGSKETINNSNCLDYG